jgi:hypothetical protein
MSMKLSLKEALARRDEWQGEPLELSVSRTPSVWIKPVNLTRTIPLAKAMTALGVRLWIAHDAVTRLAARETIAVAIPGEVNAIAAALEPYGVAVTAYEALVPEPNPGL